MRIPEMIERKRDGLELTSEEIRFFVEGYTRGDIPDYQAAAWCMALNQDANRWRCISWMNTGSSAPLGSQ